MSRWGEDAVEKKGYFCTSQKCVCLVLLFVIAGMGTVALVTVFASAVREKVEDPRETLEWWKKEIIYQIYPRSFQDTDDDGIGDIPGITKRLDYIKDLHIGAIWISPFYSSPMRDFGYDVANYTEIEPMFGTMEDFETMMTEAHAKGIQVIVDFVPNHTSNESVWFAASRNGSDEKYKDYYMWNSGIIGANGQREPPNNWQSVFGGSAWQWDEGRQQYYYHAFLDSQPDLNYSNPDVLQEIDDVLMFWLNKGVDGFRVDAIPYLFECMNVSLNEPEVINNFDDISQHPLTKSREETFDVVKRWSNLVKDFATKSKKEIVVITETVGITQDHREKYYQAGSIPFFFDLIPAKEHCGADAPCYAKIILDGTNLTEGYWPNFVMGNHDRERIADNKGPEYVDAMNMMLLTLPGTPTTYYGEELGMRGGDYTGMPPKDPFAITSNNPANSRDSERNPMQWDDSMNAGFTNGTPWLAVTPNTEYKTFNVKTESSSNSSHLSIYKRLALLRQRPAFQNANIELPSAMSPILTYIRKDRTERYLVAVNLSSSRQNINIIIPDTYGQIELSTKQRPTTQVDLANIELEIGEGLIIKLLRRK